MRGRAALLMFASGFAGLGYQIAWTQQSALWTGHEAASMLAIVAAFFGGLGLGAWWAGKRIDASAHPARWYAGCEAAIALWGIALTYLMAPASNLMLGLIGAEPGAPWQWTVAFGGTFLLLLPATVAMGATLPAMERVAGGFAGLYSANTFGAVAGVLGTALVLVPALGFSRTTLLCAALNLLCAWIAWGWRREIAPPVPAAALASRGPLITLALTGLLGIGYEVLVVRALSQVAENTIFTFAILLAVYLIGTALGAAAYARRGRATLSTSTLLLWQAWACLAGMALLAMTAPLNAWIAKSLGSGMAAAITAEVTLACAAFLLPTCVMGALFSHLALAARAAGASFGMALGVNTLAAAIAPLIFGVLLLPAVGTTLAMLLVVAGYLLASGLPAWKSAPQLATAAVLLAVAWWRPPLASATVPEGGRVMSHAEGVSATVEVIEDAHGTATLHINNRQQEGSSATLYSDARQGLLPLLLHPAPKRALFLGLGTGATVRSAGLDAELRVDAVELLPEVIEASAIFARLQEAPAQPHVRLLPADARRFVRSARDHYDVIVSDNFHPARSGSASLYTVEHFAAVRDRLAAGGLFCQWLPLHQMDLPTLRSIARSYTAVFPNSWAVLATNSLDTPVVGLVARRGGEPLTLTDIRARLHSARVAVAQGLDLGDELGLLGNVIAGPPSLERFGAGAPLNTDDHPVVAWMAPRATYQPEGTPRARLLALLEEVDPKPAELLADSDGIAPRLADYWAARDRYLQVGSAVTPSSDLRDMLRQVREPLLSVLRISPEFRPAYDPLVSMARDLARSDAQEARSLLVKLAALSPGRHEARDALAELGLSVQP
jgi:spermidine synthase